MQLKRNKEMKFETLRKSHKKEIIIGSLAICVIGGALTFATTRAKYKLTQDIELAKGTINYKPYDFKVMAMYQSEDGNNYTEINDMPSSGYIINEEKTYCTTDNKTQVKGKIKTVNGIYGLYNISKNDKCYLYFDKIKITNTISLIANSKINIVAPDFSQKAIESEGIFAIKDGMYGGTSYYWRGAVTDNYVEFANFCWRIIRINGDGSMRLIYDGTSCHANGTTTINSIAKNNQAYNTNANGSEYVGWTFTTNSQRPSNDASIIESNAKAQTEEWYVANITGANANKVAEGKFCNNRYTNSGWSSKPSNSFYYDNPSLTLNCNRKEDIYILFAGAITVDEAILAGGKIAAGANNNFYLYNGYTYWTMSPAFWSSFSLKSTMYTIYSNGNIDASVAQLDKLNGIRPVINLKSDVTFSGGNGTQSNPYVVE